MAPSESLISELNLRIVLIISNKSQNRRESHLRRRWRSLFSVSCTIRMIEVMLPYARLQRGFVVMFYNATISVDMSPLAPSEFFTGGQSRQLRLAFFQSFEIYRLTSQFYQITYFHEILVVTPIPLWDWSDLQFTVQFTVINLQFMLTFWYGLKLHVLITCLYSFFLQQDLHKSS